MLQTKRNPGLTVSDIRRAFLNGGDVSAFVPVLRQALGNAPVPNLASLELPVLLPEATALLDALNADLSRLVGSWQKGRRSEKTTGVQADLTIIGVAPYGKNVSTYLDYIIDDIRPDIITFDVSPSLFGMNVLYAFGIPGVTGIPIRGEIRSRISGQSYALETFYPGNACQTLILRCWQDRLPLIPAGMPRVYRQTLQAGFGGKEPALRRTQIYKAFDETFEEIVESGTESVIRSNQRLCSALGGHVSGQITERQIEEANYIVSRIKDIAGATTQKKKQKKLLVIVDVVQYSNLQHALEILSDDTTGKVYTQPQRDISDAIMFSSYSLDLEEEIRQQSPLTTAAGELFRNKLEKWSQSREREPISETELLSAITSITGKTRNYPGVLRGTSVRGAIAFKEVIQSLGEMQGSLHWGDLKKAALITLVPRITVKHETSRSSTDIIKDITGEVMYGIRFTARPFGISSIAEFDWLTPEDMLDIVQDMDSAGLPTGQERQISEDKMKNMAVVEDGFEELPEFLSQEDIIQGSNTNRSAMAATQAIQNLMDKLEQKFARGEIAQGQYQREKHKLQEMLNAAAYLSSPTADKELARTSFELMDAQDRHWAEKLNFPDTHVYYHIKGTSEGKDLSPPKRNYHGLKMLIDTMKREGILQTLPKESTFVLTADALNLLLESMIPRSKKGKELTDIIIGNKTMPSEHTRDIRRYSPGDVFRDISIRHTLREIAKQKRKPNEIQRSDLRVFMRQPRKLQSDVVLCIDTSGSMGFQHKLTYARLAAGSLIRTLLKRGDKIGIIAFDDLGRIVLPVTTDKNDLMKCISGIHAGGNTNIGDGILCAAQLLLKPRSQNQKYIILITDGLPSAISQDAYNQLSSIGGKDLTEEYAILETRKASTRGLKTSVLHITQADEAGKDFVKAVADAGNGEVTRVRFIEDLGLVMP